MSAHAQLEQWTISAIARATGIDGEADIAAHLLAQTTADDVAATARDLLGASPAVAAFAKELSAKRGLTGASQRDRRRKAKGGGDGGRLERAPLNCLRCGYVTSVAVARRETPAAPSAAYDDVSSRLGDRKADWPPCGFCGGDLADGPPAPPPAKALARRLVQYRRGADVSRLLFRPSPPPRNIHVPAAAAPRPVFAEYPRPRRGGAATRLYGYPRHLARSPRYDREAARRTHVIDDQNDWYDVAASTFSTAEEAAEAWRREEERREACAKREFRIDLASGQVEECQLGEGDDCG